MKTQKYLIFKMTALVICSLLLTPAVQADNRALERAQFMLRQLNAQKVELEQNNASLTAEIDHLRKQSAKQLKQQKAGNKKLGEAGKKKDLHIEKLREKLRETLIALRQSEQQRLQANSIGQVLDAQVKQCVSNNHKLVLINDQLIDNYNKKSCRDVFAQNEPFTAINKVKLENILQEYRFENEDLKVNQSAEYQQIGESVGIVDDSGDKL